MNKTEARNNIEGLKALMPEGSTVYTILRSVSRSGMQRKISLVTMSGNAKDGFVDLHPNWSAAQALGRRTANANGHDAIVCNGCGMDMGFDLVYSLSQVLYGDGYALKQRWL